MDEEDPLIAYEDTGGEDIHHPYSAFNQGFYAREQDIPRSLNPYEEDSRESDWWYMGWDHIDEPD